LIRYFAGAVPSDVVGMIYIDPTDLTLSPTEEIAIFESIGAGAAARDAFYGLMERAMANASAPLRAEGAVVVSLLKRDLPARKLPELPNVSSTVILAGKTPFLPQGELPFDAKKYVEAMHQDRAVRLRGWVHGQGEFIVAPNAGHFVHAEAPEVVIEAIRRLVH
jgi:pimeloyl-ACP methyl ester carboxylesterase